MAECVLSLASSGRKVPWDPADRLAGHVAWTCLPQGASAPSEEKQTAGLGVAVSARGQPDAPETQHAVQPGKIVHATGQ